MARILFGWELGGGNGHLAPFYAVAGILLATGHEITLAVREPSRAARLFAGQNVKIMPSPKVNPHAVSRSASAVNYTQVLKNVGFDDEKERCRVLHEWDAIQERARPDLIIADHAPGLLIASKLEPHATVLIGNGFSVPPPMFPMPRFAYCERISIGPASQDSTTSHTQTIKEEEIFLGQINDARKHLQLKKLDALGELFDQRRARFLTTFPELDHYDNREDQAYHGALSYKSPVAETVSWPVGSSPRIFAYLKPSNGLGHLFEAIGASGCSAIAVMDIMEISALKRLAPPNVRILDRPIDISIVSQQCDFGIANATHGVTGALLLAGKPILQIPRNLEQGITARRTADLGASVSADKNDGLSILNAFQAIRFDPQYKAAAQAFADQYRRYSSEAAMLEIASEICRRIG